MRALSDHWDKFPDTQNLRREVYFGLVFSEYSVHGYLAPRQSWHGERVWQRKASHPTVARRKREKRRGGDKSSLFSVMPQ